MVLIARIDELCARCDAVTVPVRLDKATDSMDNMDRSISGISEKKDIANEFVWIIDALLEKVNTSGIALEIFSDAFYSHENGYKMKLRLISIKRFCYGVYVQWCLMRGPFDDDLQWPFRHDVTIDIIDQRTGLVYKTTSIIFANDENNESLNKPVKEKNCTINFFNCTTEEISAITARQKKDQLLLKCTVHVTPE